jgi:hypothetical protein
MASPSWVILDVAPRLAADAPRPARDITKLDVGPSVYPADPDTQARVSEPCIRASDPSGLLLAIAPPSMSEQAPKEPRVCRGPDGTERTVHIQRPLRRRAGHDLRPAPEGRRRRQASPRLRLLLREAGRHPPLREAQQRQKFRFVEMGCEGKRGAPKVTMRTLADPDTAEWTIEYQVSFAEVWAGDSYKSAGLPEKAPVFALIHPKNPDVLYFFLGEYIFGVDMPARKVVEFAAHELAVPSSKGGRPLV